MNFTGIALAMVVHIILVETETQIFFSRAKGGGQSKQLFMLALALTHLPRRVSHDNSSWIFTRLIEVKRDCHA
jgi:hypothetical protein